jgi:NADPH-dependent 2,4-dienoyl-CoA reductase/sulfur reductase-like enzyme
MTVQCATNPWSLREEYYRCLPPLARKKKVVVVGGGPAGLEAAVVASSRGHEVALFEKDAQLGGNLRVASTPDFKSDMRRFLEFLVRQIEKSGAVVRLGVEATAERVEAERPDELIVAVGAEPVELEVSGAERDDVRGMLVPAEAVFTGQASAGRRVVVAGCGGIGLEAALALGRQGRQVEVVEVPGGSAQDQTVNVVDHRLLLPLLEELGIVPRPEWTIQGIAPGLVTVMGEADQKREIPADTVVVAAARRPRREVVDALRPSVEQVYVVGDCKAPRILYDAVHEGFDAALEL